MQLNEFVEKIDILEQQCLHFEMTENDYDDLFSYLLSRKRIKHLKKHFCDQMMNYYDLLGIEVNYINPHMAEITKIVSTRIRELKVCDIIVKINEQTDFFGRMQLNSNKITVCAIRNLYDGTPALVEETIPFPEIRLMEEKITVNVFKQQKCGMVRIIDFNFEIQSFEETLKKLVEAGVNTLLFDLRGNMGGSVKRVNLALDMLLPKDSVKYTYVDKQNNEKIERVASEGQFHFHKIIILLDRFSLSSAEIFTGALRDNLGAVVAGERSGGKGTIIVPLKIEKDSYVMLPKYEYLTPNGEKVERGGIAPDTDRNELVKILGTDICLALGIE